MMLELSWREGWNQLELEKQLPRPCVSFFLVKLLLPSLRTLQRIWKSFLCGACHVWRFFSDHELMRWNKQAIWYHERTNLIFMLKINADVVLAYITKHEKCLSHATLPKSKTPQGSVNQQQLQPKHIFKMKKRSLFRSRLFLVLMDSQFFSL